MACGCSKNKDKDKDNNKKKTKKKGKPEKHDLLYIMNPNCGWCKKADPVVEELVKAGYDITTLDINNPEDAERANSAKSKYKAQCGTPLFLDAETGNMACGFKEKDVLEKWAKGEEIPAPPPRQQPPNNAQGNNQPQIENLKLEYVWLDSEGQIRSKSRYQRINVAMIGNNNILRMCPSWGFDGSSTNQSKVDKSDCVLRPVKVVPNPIDELAKNDVVISYIVLCEVYDIDGKPHPTNHRAELVKSVSSAEKQDTIIGFEQEYVLIDSLSKLPIGWDNYKNNTPNPQGDYYCGVGAGISNGRNLAETHAKLCNNAGVSILSINSEVMLSQWEYSTAPRPVLMAADDVILSRFILQRLAEDMNIEISYKPKTIEGNEWNGSGGHINISTDFMRSESDLPYMSLLCSSLEKYHEEALLYYGEDNDLRLTGNNETSNINEFTFGELDRTASIRIPYSTIVTEGKGHIEDRRPAANINPYMAFNYIYTTISKIEKELQVEVQV
jgi:glutamine synthetase